MTNRGGRSVVVTGVGLVSAHGLGLEPLAAALARGRPRAVTFDPALPATGRRPPVATASLVTLADWGEWLSPLAGRRMSRPSQLGTVAAKMALADAGLATPAQVDPRCGVVLSTVFGAVRVTERLLDQLLAEGPGGMSPFAFMESVINAPAGQVAIHCRAGGPNLSICQREAGPLATLGRGAAGVAAARADRVLVGATEEVTPLLVGILDRFGALAATPRPLDRRRDGFLAAEGATVLLMEEEAAARARGARLYARVRAWGGAFDPAAPRSDWGRDPSPLVRSIAAGLARLGLGPEGLDAVVCGASGARRGDRLEAAVIRQLFTAGPPPVFAPKGVTGEYGGAFLAAALLALGGRPLAPPEAFGQADPELGVVPHDGSELGPLRRLLLLGTAAGGAAAWGILEAPAP